MHTARSLTLFPSMHCAGGGAWSWGVPGGVCSGGVWSRGVPGHWGGVPGPRGALPGGSAPGGVPGPGCIPACIEADPLHEQNS